MSQSSHQKKKNKQCSCFELLKRAFSRQSQQSNTALSAKTDIQSFSKAVAEGTTGTTVNFTSVQDLSNATILRRGANLNSVVQQQNASNLSQKENAQGKQQSHNPLNNIFRGTFIQQYLQNNVKQEDTKECQEEYVFRFQQRQEYLNKKFATKRDQNMNEHCKTTGNFTLQTLLQTNEIKYCDSISNNYFLLKYFKYECGLCLKLCSHILVANCCTGPICLSCSVELAEHYEDNGPVKKCVFCSLPVDVRYLIRDATQSEQRILHSKCKETLKMLEQKKRGGNKRQQKNSQKDNNPSMVISDNSNNNSYIINIPLEASAIKPKKLEFVEESNLKTAISSYRIPDYELTLERDTKSNIFDDVFNSQEDQNFHSNYISNKTQTTKFYSTEQFNSTQPLEETHTEQNSEILLESKIRLPKNLMGRKRIGNKKLQQQLQMQKYNDDSLLYQELPLTKRLRNKRLNKSSDSTLNVSISSSAVTIQRQSKKIKK